MVASQNEFGEFTFNSHDQNMEVMVVLTIDFTGAPAGKYVVACTFRDKMSDKMAYDIVKTLWEKKPELVAVHKEAEHIDLKNQKSGTPVPYHPGAKKYLEEQGVKF